jgi:hypothetical protein
MLLRVSTLLLLSALLAIAAPKNIATAKGENQDLALTVTLYIDSTAIKSVLGDDLGGHYIVAEVKVEPKYTKEIAIDRDDFVLRATDNGEKSTPFSASQVAGRGVLVVKYSQGVGLQNPTAGPPPMVPGGVIVPGRGSKADAGGSKGDGGAGQATMHDEDKENPLEATLDAKILREEKTDQPVSGLLYFPMEKKKMKDLELDFGGKENRIELRFK